MTTLNQIEHKPFEHTNENHCRAMRALVNKLTNENFKFWKVTDDHLIYIGIAGWYYDTEYENGEFEEYSGYLDERSADNTDHIAIDAKISQEMVDIHETQDAFDDIGGPDEFVYPPIELVDDPKVWASWAMRILANELIKNNFDPNGFRTHPFYPFSLKVELEEFSFNFRATVRKDKYRLLSDGDRRSR
jgi:hypothetical protein